MHILPNKMDNLEDNDGKAPQGSITVLGYTTHVAPEHPYILNEYGWLWINRDGTPTTMSSPVFDALLGVGPHTPGELWEAYAYLVGGQTRTWRAKRGYDAIQHFVYLGYSKKGGATSDNFLDVEALWLEPRWQQQAKWAFAKVIPFIDRWQLKAAKSGLLKVPLLAINDRPVKTAARLAVMAIDDTGKVIAQHGQDVSIAALGSWQGAVELAGVVTRVAVYAAMSWQGADGATQVSADLRKVGYGHLGLRAPPPPAVSSWP